MGRPAFYSLAEQNQAPAVFSRISRREIPAVALLFSSGCALTGVLLNYVAPKEVFVWLTAVSTFGAIWTWCVILLSQYRFRNAKSEGGPGLSFRVPIFPYGSFFAGGFLLLILGLMSLYPGTRVAVVVGPIWIVSLVCTYFIVGYHKVSADYAKRAV
jgi:amino acid transporter, AAT family